MWLNVFIGALAGLFFGVLAGTLTGLISYARRRMAQGEMRPGNSSDRFWRAAAVATAVIIAVPIGLGVFGLFVGIVVPNFFPNPESAMRFPQVAPPGGIQPPDGNSVIDGISTARRFVGRAGDETIELLAVSTVSRTNREPWRPGSYTNQLWWLPDGTPTDAKYDAGPVIPRFGPGHSGEEYEFVFRAGTVAGLLPKVAFPDQEMQPTVRFPRQDHRFVPGIYLASVSLPESKNATDMSVSIAAGPWQVDTALNGFGEEAPVETNILCGGFDWNVAVQLSETNGAIHLTGHYPLHWSDGWDQELALLAGDGHRYLYSTNASVIKNGSVAMLELDQMFDNLRLRDIHEVRFRARPYQTVRFRNVSLQPNFKTVVQIEDAPRLDLENSP